MAAMNYRGAAEAALVAGTGETSAPSLPVPSDGAGGVPDSPPQQKSGWFSSADGKFTLTRPRQKYGDGLNRSKCCIFFLLYFSITAILTFKIPIQSWLKFKLEVIQGLFWILAILHTCYLCKLYKCCKIKEEHSWEILMPLIKLIFNPIILKLWDIHTDCKVNCILRVGLLCKQHSMYTAGIVHDD